jgi:uncharacterized membrane protein
MAIFQKLGLAMTTGFGLALLLLLIFHTGLLGGDTISTYLSFFFRWLHVVFGIVWIGLLYYFNLVQIPTMPKVPAELKPGVSKYIAPEALFWFRWAAILTVVTGLVVAHLQGYMTASLLLQPPATIIGIGMWLGIIMAINVWVFIWPNQKKALGLVPADDATKAAAAKTAMIFSRTNFMLSIPMLYCMVAQQNVGAG